MEKFLKSIKFVNLLEQGSNCYITACEDKKTVTLIRAHDRSKVPQASEWKVKWVIGPTGALTGKCRFHSIYKKVLVVRREGEGQASYLRVYQDRWPASHQDTAGEWTLSLKQLGLGPGLEAQLIIEYENQRYFLSGPKSMMYSYENRIVSPRLETRGSACQSQLHDWILYQVYRSVPKTVSSDQQQQKVKEEQKRVTTISTTTSSTAVISRDGQLISLTGWQVGQVVLNYYTPGGVGGGYSHFNAGHNVNGSGTQTNGDVNVRTEVGKTRDVSVSFTNNKS